jgi:hypothetical protein
MINQATDSFDKVQSFAKVQKAIEFKEAYKHRTGHRPSLVSIIVLWQDAEAKLAALHAKVAMLEAAGGPL